MKKSFSIIICIILLLVTLNNGVVATDKTSSILNTNMTRKYFIDPSCKTNDFTDTQSPHSMINIRNKGLQRISIKAEYTGFMSSNLGANIGPIWLTRNIVQFTIYEGDTEIQIDGETQTISDFPAHIVLLGFYGFGPMPFFRLRGDIHSIHMFGFCREIVITPYYENHITMHDQPLFNLLDLEYFGQCTWGLTAADFNNDTWMDFAVSHATNPFQFGTITILYNQKNQTFSQKDVYYRNDYIDDLDSGDFDGDGDIDLMFTYSESMDIGGGLMMATNGTVNILFNDGQGNFMNETMIVRHCSEDLYSEFGRFNPQLTTGDYDKDGDFDFLVGDNSGMVVYYINDGQGHFSSEGIIHDFGAFSWGLTSYDFDGDNDQDVIVAAGIYQEHGYNEGCVYCIQNMIQESNSSITFNHNEGEKLIYYSSVGGAACIQSIDYNNDSHVDLVVGINDALVLCLRTSDSFEFFPLNEFALERGCNDIRLGGLTAADFNRDGKEDLFAGGVQGIIRILWSNYSDYLPPLRPAIIKPTSAEYDPGEVMEFCFLSNDANGDEIFYLIEWGDGNTTEWLGPYPSGEKLCLTHVWDEEGGYWIRAKAKDSDGFESGWNQHRLTLIDN